MELTVDAVAIIAALSIGLIEWAYCAQGPFFLAFDDAFARRGPRLSQACPHLAERTQQDQRTALT
jgi:hypothetical protein